MLLTLLLLELLVRLLELLLTLLLVLLLLELLLLDEDCANANGAEVAMRAALTAREPMVRVR